MATKKASPAQIAARKLFAERARAGTLKKRSAARKQNPIGNIANLKKRYTSVVVTLADLRSDPVSDAKEQARLIKLFTQKARDLREAIAMYESEKRNANPLPAGNTFNSGSRMTMGELYKNPAKRGRAKTDAAIDAALKKRYSKNPVSKGMYFYVHVNTGPHKVGNVHLKIKDYTKLGASEKAAHVLGYPTLIAARGERYEYVDASQEYAAVFWVYDAPREGIKYKTLPARKANPQTRMSNPVDFDNGRRMTMGALYKNPLQKRVSVSKGKANFPWLVQVQNTENWNTHAGFKSKPEAVAIAQMIADKHPKLPVRVLHYTGGPLA